MAESRTPLAGEIQALYAKGDMAGAIAVARAMGEAVISDADASLFAGLAFAAAGSLDEAAIHLLNVRRMRPGDPGAIGALARVHLLRHETAEAEKLIQALETIARTDVLAVLHLSDTYLQAQQPENAFHLLSAARARFDHPLIEPRLAESAFRTRRPHEGIAAARRAQALLGAHPSALMVAGPAALIANDTPWLNNVRETVEKFPPPQAAAIFDNWTNMLMNGNQLSAALYSAELAASLMPTLARWRIVSDFRLGAQQMSGAESAALSALACNPKDPSAMTLLARCRMMSGDIGDAKRILIDAITIDPSCAVAFDYLSQIDPGAMSAEMVKDLEELVGPNRPASDSRPKALLALARRKEFDGDPAKAFSLILEANSLIANSSRDAGVRYQPEEVDAAVERMKKNLGSPPLSSAAPMKQRFVFVVGMPRSGTSLVEQIISSHSTVYGAGELPGMIGIMREFDQKAAGDDAAMALSANAEMWRTRYLEALPAEAKTAAVVTDKHPLNFWSVGVIRGIFPDAAIINLNRSPIDVCLSIMRQRFFAEYSFANEIDSLAHYYAAYERMMDHWRAIFADAIYDVSYEELVASPVTAVGSILTFCGLTWEESCLEFHRTKRNVITHSAAQVREPINTRGLDRRRLYGDALKPLEDALIRCGVQIR